MATSTFEWSSVNSGIAIPAMKWRGEATIDLKLSHEILCRSIVDFAARCNEFKQVANRLEKVLPDRLKDIERRYRRSHPAGRASRFALADQAYEAYIDQFINIASDALKSRILWETHCQLIDARRTLKRLKLDQIDRRS